MIAWQPDGDGNYEAFNVGGAHIGMVVYRYPSGWEWSAWDEFKTDSEEILSQSKRPAPSEQDAKAAAQMWLDGFLAEEAPDGD